MSVERTLVVLQAVALCCLLTAAVLRAVDAVQTGDGLAVAITWLALVPIITALWALRPRVVRAGHGVEWTMLAVLLATPVAVFGTLDFTIPALPVATVSVLHARRHHSARIRVYQFRSTVRVRLAASSTSSDGVSSHNDSKLQV